MYIKWQTFLSKYLNRCKHTEKIAIVSISTFFNDQRTQSNIAWFIEIIIETDLYFERFKNKYMQNINILNNIWLIHILLFTINPWQNRQEVKYIIILKKLYHLQLKWRNKHVSVKNGHQREGTLNTLHTHIHTHSYTEANCNKVYENQTVVDQYFIK